MSTARDDLVFDEDNVWQPPRAFRDKLADAERMAAWLLQEIETDGSLLVPAERLQFMAKRLFQLAHAAHRALPAEVT